MENTDTLEHTAPESPILDFNKYMKCTKALEEQAVPSGNIYHYTDWGGLQGILKSQQLWLTEYRHLNDTSEIQFATQEIHKHIMEVAIIKSFWDALFQDIDTHIQAGLSHFRGHLINHIIP